MVRLTGTLTETGNFLHGRDLIPNFPVTLEIYSFEATRRTIGVTDVTDESFWCGFD